MKIEFKEEPGWTGVFTRNQVAGALPNGTRIRKVKIEPNDAHPLGTGGVVLGSISHPEVANGQPMYFIEWDPSPRIAVGVMGWKIEAAESHEDTLH